MEEPKLQPLLDVLQQFKSGGEPSRDAADRPLALIVPSTIETVTESTGLRDSGFVQLVGGIEIPGFRRPADIVSLLRTGAFRPDLIILSDQILDPADACVLVRTDGADQYFSPLEAILNMKYGYRLAIWTSHGYIDIPPHAADMAVVFQKLALYLSDCEKLETRWKAGGLQKRRLPAERQRIALRKIRHFRSAVLNTFRDSPNDLDGLALLRGSDALERQVTAPVAA